MTFQPKASFHVVRAQEDGLVTAIHPIAHTNLWLNAGYFIFRQSIFDYIKYGEELVEEPFQRLIAQEKLTTYNYKGFWQAMDTFKDKMLLDDLLAKSDPPWEVWNRNDHMTPQMKINHDTINV